MIWECSTLTCLRFYFTEQFSNSNARALVTLKATTFAYRLGHDSNIRKFEQCSKKFNPNFVVFDSADRTFRKRKNLSPWQNFLLKLDVFLVWWHRWHSLLSKLIGKALNAIWRKWTRCQFGTDKIGKSSLDWIVLEMFKYLFKDSFKCSMFRSVQKIGQKSCLCTGNRWHPEQSFDGHQSNSLKPAQ